jgi:hypothetical protein
MKKYLILFAFTAILYSCEKDTLTSKEYEYQPDGLYFSGYLNNEYFYVNDSVPNTITISTTTYYYWRPDSFLINFKCIYPLDDNRRLVLRYCLIGNIIELDTITNNYNDFENMISEGSYEYLFAGTTPSSGFDILLLEGDSINYSAANEDWDFDTAFVFNISEMMYNGNINNKNYSGQEIIFTGNLKCNMRHNLNHEEILTINNATIKAKFSQGHYN